MTTAAQARDSAPTTDTPIDQFRAELNAAMAARGTSKNALARALALDVGSLSKALRGKQGFGQAEPALRAWLADPDSAGAHRGGAQQPSTGPANPLPANPVRRDVRRSESLGEGSPAAASGAQQDAGNTTDSAAFTVPLDRLRISAENHRKDEPVDDAFVAVLAKSIARDGLKQPLEVRPVAGVPGAPGEQEYEITDGRNRWLAYRLRRRNVEIPADAPVRCTLARPARASAQQDAPGRSRLAADDDALLGSLLANILRQDIHPLAEGRGYARWLDRNPGRSEQLAELVFKDQRHVQQRAAVYRRSTDKVKALFYAGRIGFGQARGFIRGPDSQQDAVAAELEANPGWNPTEAEIADAVTAQLVPVARARFDVDGPLAAGLERFTDGNKRDHFVGIAPFVTAQRTWAKAEAERLRSEEHRRWVKVLAGVGQWHPWQYKTVADVEGAGVKLTAKQKRQAGAAILIEPIGAEAGIVTVHDGLWTIEEFHAEVEAARTKAAKAPPPAADEDDNGDALSPTRHPGLDPGSSSSGDAAEFIHSMHPPADDADHAERARDEAARPAAPNRTPPDDERSRAAAREQAIVGLNRDFQAAVGADPALALRLWLWEAIVETEWGELAPAHRATLAPFAGAFITADPEEEVDANFADEAAAVWRRLAEADDGDLWAPFAAAVAELHALLHGSNRPFERIHPCRAMLADAAGVAVPDFLRNGDADA